MRKWLTRSMAPVAIASTALVLGAIPAAPSGGDITTLVAVLDGAQEVPGPGDDDGRGAFGAVVKGDKLCYVLTAFRIETATAAHIHPGAAGEANPPIVLLRNPNRFTADCITAVPDDQDSLATMSESELAAIVANPSDFYVNVHTASFGAGAIRGQLR